MSGHQDLNTQSLKLQQGIDDYLEQPRVEIRFRLVPEQDGTAWQCAVADQEAKETELAQAFRQQRKLDIAVAIGQEELFSSDRYATSDRRLQTVHQPTASVIDIFTKSR